MSGEAAGSLRLGGKRWVRKGLGGGGAEGRDALFLHYQIHGKRGREEGRAVREGAWNTRAEG